MIVAGIAVSLARGGAGLAAERLFTTLDQQPGTRVDRLIARRDPGSPKATLFTEPGRFRVVADQVVDILGLASHRSWQGWNARSNFATLQWMIDDIAPDVINLHGFNQWYRPTIDPADWISVAGKAPLVWTLHDFWPVTGCCDYLTECPQFAKADPASPGPRSTCERSSQQGLRIKAAIEAVRGRIVFVSPSRWLADVARPWLEGSTRIEVIPNGLDLSVFAPHDAAAARRALNWPDAGRLVLTVAENLDAPRKGMALLQDAWRSLRGAARLVTLGETKPERWPGGTLHAGTILDPRLLKLVYAAVDAVVVPSQVDNLPNVLLEAIACGTPCVGFDVGGIPEVIRENQTGWLARRGDAADLARALNAAVGLDDAGRAALRASCRCIAETKYGSELQARRYLDVFQSFKR
jgi:glycosyltransferase involved in cell wall biosynthesis